MELVHRRRDVTEEREVGPRSNSCMGIPWTCDRERRARAQVYTEYILNTVLYIPAQMSRAQIESEYSPAGQWPPPRPALRCLCPAMYCYALSCCAGEVHRARIVVSLIVRRVWRMALTVIASHGIALGCHTPPYARLIRISLLCSNQRAWILRPCEGGMARRCRLALFLCFSPFPVLPVSLPPALSLRGVQALPIMASGA